ncbi:hypothetical protein GCK32_015132 [Trichostrongylus colubriformis]|uniref:Uncharacterized protein n=1 Tax=Trichostrongylus colubriformis TaxID=6319 RepID=A0AAN8FNH5_TRICO
MLRPKIGRSMNSPLDEVIDAFAETMQSLGLLLDKEIRLSLIRKIIDSLTSTQLLDMFCLFILQSQDPSIMRHVVTLPVCTERSSYYLFTGIANHEDNVAEVFSFKAEVSFKVDCAIAKGLLLRGRMEGLSLFDEVVTSHEFFGSGHGFEMLCSRFSYSPLFVVEQRQVMTLSTAN